MKKLFFVVLAAAAMVACTNDEVVSIKGGDAIAFENAFIDNATRAADPSTTTADIDAFDVWAFMDEPAGIVFEDEDVTKGADGWGYVNTQYWLPGHKYYFAALAPMNSANWDLDTTGANTYGAGVVSFTNVDGGEDLIYAAASVETAGDINTQPDPVKFYFNHLLSKVKFTFVNGFDNENADVEVTNIKMTVPANGTIDLAQADWWSTNEWELGTETTTLSFGDVELLEGANASDECADERLTIPATAAQKYTITFDAELFMGGVSAIKSEGLTAVVENVALEMGKAYNFKAELNAANISEDGSELYPIEFDVIEVKEWVNGGEHTATVVDDYVEPIVVTDGQTYDGQGSTVIASDGRAAGQNGIFTPEGTVTIKNVTIDGNNETTESGQVMRGIYIKKGGVYTVDNVKILNCGYSMNDGTSETVVWNVSNSTLQSWISWGATTTANFTNVEFIPGTYAIMRPQGDANFTNCEFADGFKFSLDLLKGTLTFENCLYNGEALTKEIVAANVCTDYYADGIAADANLDKVVIK